MAAFIFIMLLAFAGAFIQRTIGFGFGIFVMTMLPYLLPSYGEATALSGLMALGTSALLVYKYWNYINWRNLLPILCIFLLISLVAIRVVVMLDTPVLKKILGVTLIISFFYFWFFAKRIKLRPNVPTQTCLGTLSGFMGGFFGMQGPPAVLYFIEVAKNKEEYIALAQTYFAIGNFMMTLYRWHAGFVTSQVVLSWAISIPAVFIGTAVGSYIFKLTSLDALRRIVFIYIGISGILALFF